MTELQTTIKRLEQVTFEGYTLLAKLTRAEKDLEKPKVPEFPIRFIAVRDCKIRDTFVIGLEQVKDWPDDLPKGFKGRAMFNRGDIWQIIRGLQTLLGESNG